MLGRSFPNLRSHFFVDTNTILDYKMGLPNIKGFIDDRSNVFYFTETVREQLQKDSVSVPGRFNYMQSTLTWEKKRIAMRMLYEFWHKEFDKDSYHIRKGLGLTKRQLLRFQRDLFVVFETCNHAREIPLVMSNKELLRKFTLRAEAENVFEVAICLSLVGQPIPVLYIGDVIEEWLSKKASSV